MSYARVNTVSVPSLATMSSFHGVGASCVARKAVPIQPPSAPAASTAASVRPEPMPPAASSGMSGNASRTDASSGRSPSTPVWPPASFP